jgi:hypothetical protein
MLKVFDIIIMLMALIVVLTSVTGEAGILARKYSTCRENTGSAVRLY